MKTSHKILLVSILLATPFAAAQAQSSRASHEAWIKAQKIDIQPTLKITETEIPAGSPATSTGPGNTGTGTPGSQMPQPGSAPVPDSQVPAYNTPATGPSGNAPIQDRSTMPYGSGQQPK
ncbi:MAG TPA: hypothetical protein VIP51_15025 [Eoetvoesiella sp.]